MTGETTLLKATDYPFFYSVAFIVLSTSEYVIKPDSLPLLLLAGFGATFLAVVNPVGYGIQKTSKSMINGNFHQDYKKNSVYTKAINFEKDKIVSVIYFITIIVIFLIAFWSSSIFESKFELNYKPIANCDFNCFKNTVTVMLIVSTIILIYSVWYFSKRFLCRSETVATFLYFIEKAEHSQRKSRLIDKVENYIEKGNWQMAEYYVPKLMDYIQNPKRYKSDNT